MNVFRAGRRACPAVTSPWAPLLHLRGLITLGIRREDPRRVWERRVPLTPDAVGRLLNEGAGELAVEVESCTKRCFPDHQYHEAGAKIVPKLSKEVDVVAGIKEPPVQTVHDLIASDPNRKRTWMVFSHTHKGQPYNTPLLSAFMDDKQNQTLIDYELLMKKGGAAEGKLVRAAAFGRYAGIIGAGEALCLTGQGLLRRGVATSLLHLPRPYTFKQKSEYEAALEQVGQAMREDARMRRGAKEPVLIGLTGRGIVSKGAKEMLDIFGLQWVSQKDLKDLPADGSVYGCWVQSEDVYERKDRAGAYDREHYFRDPSAYRSTFAQSVAPYLTTIVNGAGWQSGSPRLMDEGSLEQLVQSSGGKSRLVAVQDIACDLKGGLAFVDKHTTIDAPFFEAAGGVLVSSIDILPTELPINASKDFSQNIAPYIQRVLTRKSGRGSAADEMDAALSSATIVKDGQLVPRHQHLDASVSSWRQGFADKTPSGGAPGPRKPKKVLLLGSGLVAGPAVEEFAGRSDVSLRIASNNLPEAQGLIQGRSNVEAMKLDVSDEEALRSAVAGSDVVVSLLPAPMHTAVAEHCIAHGKHLVTASYISPEMKALDGQARDNGVLLLGECGLDPGIDSMAAMRILERVKREGKKVRSFVSWCGGLPEPGASNVPLGYKFSWSPKAVLTAALNDARFKLDGKEQAIPGDKLLETHFKDVELWKGLKLEGLANRDSMPYAEKYGLGEVDGLKDLFRGTLRYKGFSRMLDTFRSLGLMSTKPLDEQPSSWTDFLSKCATASGAPIPSGSQETAFSEVAAVSSSEAEEALKWLGLLGEAQSAETSLPAIPAGVRTPIDLLAVLLSHKLAYKPHERDMCLLYHSFVLEPSTPGGKEERVTASLLHYGTAEASAMATTVGKTLAFAALRVVDGHIQAKGVKGPYEREVWEGVLDDLERVGVRVEENWETAH